MLCNGLVPSRCTVAQLAFGASVTFDIFAAPAAAIVTDGAGACVASLASPQPLCHRPWDSHGAAGRLATAKSLRHHGLYLRR